MSESIERSIYEQANWSGPMLNGCGSCNWTWRTHRRNYCPMCIESLAEQMDALASNLYAAAMLERSRHLGVLDALQWLARIPMWPTWEPGCQRPAPETYEAHALCKATWPALHREYGTVDAKAAP